MKEDPIELIKKRYAGMNTTRRRIADYILDDPARCSFLSIRELAKCADTTDVTLIAFSKSLGFSSFADLRKSIQEHVLLWSRASERMKFYTSAFGDASELFARIADTERLSVEEAFRRNDLNSLFSAVKMMKDSSRILIASHNASRIAASYLQYRLLSLGIETYLLDLAEVHQSVTRIEAAKDDEATLISIATPPYGAPTTAFTRLCRKMGMGIISFTDHESSPLVELSDISFICPSMQNFGGMTNSYVPFFAIFDALSFFYSYDSAQTMPKSDLEKDYSDIIKEVISPTE